MLDIQGGVRVNPNIHVFLVLGAGGPLATVHGGGRGPSRARPRNLGRFHCGEK